MKPDDTIQYSPHYFKHAEGHIYLGDSKKGACTITLTGAASMPQEELDKYGRLFAEAIRQANPR